MAPRPLVAVALVALLAPLAAAQVPPGTPIDAVQKPLALVPGADIAEVRPLTGIGATNMSVQFRCVALSPQAATQVDLAVAEKPAWLSVTITPASVSFPANAPNPAAPAPPCTDKVVQDVAVLVSATADAPAGGVGLVQITGTSTDKTATAYLNATAGAFLQVEAGASATNGRASPTAPWTFDVTVTNRGNAKAAIEFATFAARGIRVEAAGGEVGSKQAGDASNQQTFQVKVTPESTVVNGAYPAWANLTATVPGKATVRPVRENLAFTVNVEGAAAPAEEDDGKLLPVALYAAPLALAIGALVARKRR